MQFVSQEQKKKLVQEVTASVLALALPRDACYRWTMATCYYVRLPARPRVHPPGSKSAVQSHPPQTYAPQTSADDARAMAAPSPIPHATPRTRWTGRHQQAEAVPIHPSCAATGATARPPTTAASYCTSPAARRTANRSRPTSAVAARAANARVCSA